MYVTSGERLSFRRVPPPTVAALEKLVRGISERVGRALERQGLLVRDLENSFLTLDSAEISGFDDLLGHSMTYRIALGPRQGRKAFTLQTVPAVAAVDDNSSVAKVAGFSLHAGVASEAHEREKLERLSLTTQGNIRYRLKTPIGMARRTWCSNRRTKSPGAILNSRRLARRAKGRMPGVFHGPTGRPGADAESQSHAL